MSKFEKIEELQKILQNDKTNFQARREFASLLLDLNYPEEALPHLLYLSKVFQDDSSLFFNLGITYEKLKDLNKAEIAYKKVLELEPDDIDARYNLGQVFIDKQKYNSAIECFEKVLEKDNKDSNTYFSMGLCYLKEKKLDAAKYHFQRTIEINPEDIYAHFYLGNILKEQGDIDGAREEFYKVLDISPDYSWAYFNLASMDYEMGFIEGAIDNLKKTIEYNPKDIEAYKIYIKILLKEESYDEALDIANLSISNCEDEGDLYYLRAQVYKLIDDKENFVNDMYEALRHISTLSVSPNVIKKELEN